MIDNTCNGIPLIEFCYENSDKARNNIAMSIFLGSIDNVVPDDTSFTGRLFVQKTINTTVNCNPKLSIDSICCQSEQINVSLPTQQLQQINVFGIEFPNQTLLEYNDLESIVETFVGTTIDFRGFVNSPGAQQPVLMIQGNGRFMNLNLRFLRFVIEDTSNLGASNSGRVNTTAIITTVLVIIGVMMILLVVVCVICFTIRRQKQRKKITNMNQLVTEQQALNNGNNIIIWCLLNFKISI